MSGRKQDYIVVEGPIGVGKTSLVRKLAQTFKSEQLLEQPQDNPFLERFYHAPRQYALPAQLSFLFQRSKQIGELIQGDMFRPGCVADFMLEKDRLFASVNLEDDEFRLYDQVYQQLQIDLPVPDLVIYLQAPVQVLQARIRKRGIDYERHMDNAYLESLVDAYTRFFYQYSASPLLIINTEKINLADNDADFQAMLEHLETVKSGRHYFNPLHEA
ncbi:MAG: deoxynucleoside kinase [Acidiferrobacterales bacterium]